jgi:hypothetical protein
MPDENPSTGEQEIVDKVADWASAAIIVRYKFRGKTKEKQFKVVKEDIRQEQIRSYTRDYQDIVDNYGEDSEQLQDSLPPEEFAKVHRVENFEQGVLNYAEELSRQNIIERGSRTAEFVVLPPPAIEEVVVLAQAESKIVLPN